MRSSPNESGKATKTAHKRSVASPSAHTTQGVSGDKGLLGSGVALDNRPAQQAFPVRRHCLEVTNGTALDSGLFPYGGPERAKKLSKDIANLRQKIGIDQSADPTPAIVSHFSKVAKELFIRPHEQRAVLMDGVYLVARGLDNRQERIVTIDLLTHSDRLKNLHSLLKEWRNLELELCYVAGFHDGTKTHTTIHSIACSLSERFEKGNQFPWEGALVAKDSPRHGHSLAALRTLAMMGNSDYTLPEQKLANKINTELLAPAPHIRIKSFTPAKNESVVSLSEWTRNKPEQGWVSRLQAGAQDILNDAKARVDYYSKSPQGNSFLQRMGENFCDSKYLPQKPAHSTNIWSDPYRDLFAKAMAAGYVNLSYLTHPSMLEGHLHASGQPFIPCNYKHVPALSKAIKKNQAVSYNEFGSWPLGYTTDDLLDESTTSALPNLWTQSIKGVPTLAGIVGSSMNWMAGAQGYAAAALSGFPVFIAADGLQKERSIQEELYKRTVELIKNHPLVQNYPWPEHRLSNGEKAVDYLVRTAISRVGITVKPFPTKHAQDTVAYFLDNYGIQNYRLYDPGITSLLVEGSNALESTIKQHIHHSQQIMKNGPSAGQVGYLVGQVSNMTQALTLAELEHVLGLVIGITEGGHCETGIKHGIYANNLLVLYQVVRMGLPFPILADGGPGLENLPNVLLFGGSGVLTSGGLFGGVIEHAPFNVWFIDPNGQLVKFTFGEAALATKDFGSELFGSGMPKNREGIASYKFLNPVYPTLYHKALDAAFVAAKSLRFERVSHLEQMRLLPHPRIVHGSKDADEARRPHNKEMAMRSIGDMWGGQGSL
jgi:hypothetical protein